MWILLMIVFNQPFQVDSINILGEYHQKKECQEEVKRALAIGVPIKSSFGCVKIEKMGKHSNVSHETKEIL